MSSPTVPRHALALVLAAACWGLGTVVSKQAVGELPPLTLLAGQLATSVVLLRLVAWRRAEPLPGGRDGRRLMALGALNPGLAYALGLLGLTQVSASLAVMLWALEPVLILVLAALLLRERLAPATWVLSGVAATGMVLVLYDPAAFGAPLGVALTIAGVGCCAVYTVATRRWLPAAASTLGVVLGQQAWALAATVAVLGLLGLAGRPVLEGPVTLTAAGSAVLSGVLYYALAYWLYLGALRHVPASIAATSFYLIPVFGVAAAWLTGDRFSPPQWAGAIIVIGAVASITTRSTAASPIPAGPEPVA